MHVPADVTKRCENRVWWAVCTCDLSYRTKGHTAAHALSIAYVLGGRSGLITTIAMVNKHKNKRRFPCSQL